MKSELETTVRARLDTLTKPPGSLGRLEEAVIRLALIQGTNRPVTTRKGLYVFCGDHGITAEGVSPWPSAVTREMMRNFVRGGAAINVLCRREQIETIIVDAGLNGESVAGAVNLRVGRGTRNFALEPAMSAEDALACLAVGRDLADGAASRFDIVGLGEMGIGNTTSAAAILSACSGADPTLTTGPGAGSDAARVLHKVEIVRQALAIHRTDPADGLAILRAFGGFETGALAGFLIRASERNLPVVLDGFPCGAAALIARAINPHALGSALFGHRSAEPGHDLMLKLLGADPYLSLGMRLGEGTGAALAIGILDAAVRLYSEMATFDEAGVSGDSSNLAGLA